MSAEVGAGRSGSRSRRAARVRRKRPKAEAFHLHLDNFDGPFDLLLQLISRHKLDITEVALSQVTDEFIAHIKAAGSAWDLDQTSQFVVVAATLLDLKAARLIPSGEVEDPEDLALLEARDLLFARLLAISRLSARGQLHRGDTGGAGTPISPRRRDRAALRPAVTRGDDVDQSSPSCGARSESDDAETGERVVAGPHACTGGQRSRAGHGGRRPVTPTAAP